MNVYSIRLIPSLKLKLCQFLGVASEMAIEELSGRLHQLETKIDRLDIQLRRSSRRSLTLTSVPQAETVAAVKKKPTRAAKPAAAKRPKAKPRLAEVTSIARPEALVEELAPVSFEAPVIEASSVSFEETVIETVVAAPEEVVVLIGAEEATRRAVQDYFGAGVTLIDLEGTQHLENHFEGNRVLAVIFDRSLLAQEAARETLESLSFEHGETRWLGLSSYLTLAFAESMPQREDFATYLTRPLSFESLSEVFGGEAAAPISASGQADPA
ncbi:MAG: hypothetical protein K8R69_06680 [Deltaproteobacteria bacterium]|nr:hypothetical protein [Deltaproteobacteria bacterium]